MKRIVTFVLGVVFMEAILVMCERDSRYVEANDKVVMKDNCNETCDITNSSAAVALVPTVSTRVPIASCLDCPVILTTDAADHRMFATFYWLDLESEADGTCSMARLDVYDGTEMKDESRLSGAGGICGHTFNKAYISTSNSLTVKLTTPCTEGRQNYGRFEMMVSTFKSGGAPGCPNQFTCSNGDCLNSSLICDGSSDCQDSSDETGCISTQSVFPVWAICILTLLAFAVLILIIFIIYLVVKSIMACANKNYEKV